jgi:hypothetical protein
MGAFHRPYTAEQTAYTGHTQNNGAVLIVNIIKTAPFFCVCSVFPLTWWATVINNENQLLCSPVEVRYEGLNAL